MKKLLHLITLSTWGGAQEVVYTLSSHFSGNYDITVACAPGRELIFKLKEKDIKVFEIPHLKRGPDLVNDIIAFTEIYKFIKKGKFDIIHCHSSKAGILGRLAAKLAGVPKIYFTVHGWGFYNEEYGKLKKIMIFAEKAAAKVSTKIICVSGNDKDYGIKNKIAPESKFIVINNGVIWDVQEKKRTLRKEINAPQDIIFGMVARLSYPKNPMLFLHAAEVIVAKYKNAKFVLIGDGLYSYDCKSFVDNNKLNNQIFLFGFRNDVKENLKDLDVFVLISRFEGLPISIIEAMHASLPIIASNVGGVKELVEDGKNGFLINPESKEDLIKKLEFFMENPEKIKEMGGKSYCIGRERFSVEKMAEGYKELYES